MRDQVVALEDKADRVVPVGIPVAVLILFRGNAVDDQIAAVVAVEAADDIQKRRLSGTARPKIATNSLSRKFKDTSSSAFCTSVPVRYSF